MAVVCEPVQQAFESAKRDFKASLKDDALYTEILKTTSIDEVYDATDKLQKEQAKEGHLRHLSKIQPYLEGLRYYASVIEVFIQVKPDVLALIWGPIKLILQWTSVLKQSFDAIIITLADIGVLLPEFREIAKLFDHNKQIKEVLALFFRDILDFYLIALKFFSSSRWKYFFESLWPRHREKIKVVTEHINRLTLLMRNEVRLEHIQAEHDARLRALAHFERAERSYQRQEYNSIKADISPRTYENELNRLQGHVCGGTGKWLMRDATFSKWLDISETSTKVLWLQGIPGAGKTYLCSTVVAKTQTLGRVAFAFLTHTLNSSTSALSILHSLIFQLPSDDDDLQAVLCQSSRENLKSNLDVAACLLAKLLACAGPVYIIIDGVDEIDEIERGRLMKQLLDLSKSCEDAKILMSSRPEADITRILDEKAATIRVDHRNAGSIQSFVTQLTQQWFKERGFLPEARAEIEGLLAPLASNSKGMFLYTRIILKTIEELEVPDIRRELQVLPESLDDAYGRVLAQVNSLSPPPLKEKARKLLGWIGCSPTPLTIQEMEHALTVTIEDRDGNARVLANLNLIKICGPIVEIVDDYVQFVHFTVKTYLFSPRINGFVDGTEATLSLAKCCITYLCQGHHNPEILDEEICQNILFGAYRLQEFSATMWLELIERFMTSTRSSTPPIELISILQMLGSERNNERYNSTQNTVAHPTLALFKSKWPELYEVLCRAAQFRQTCSKPEYNKRQGANWTSLDPLTISNTSVRVYAQFDTLLCGTTKHKGECHCAAIRRHHGKRPFKCGFLSCSFRQQGFETRSLRDSHMRHHDRPWKCGFPDCEFAEGGFLSRKMRDEHLDRFHKEERHLVSNTIGEPDADEMQPLLFDLIKADKVEVVKAFLPQFGSLSYAVKGELRKLAASTGSSSMLGLLGEFESGYEIADLATCSIQGRNMETFKFLLQLFDFKKDYYHSRMSYVLEGVLKSDSEEVYEEWAKFLKLEECRGSLSQTAMACNYVSLKVINATAGQPIREELLLQIWRKIDLPESIGVTYLGDSLGYVAVTTCSVRLAKVLIDYGANVNHRRSKLYMTPLHHVARKTSAEAAEMMKLLLSQGANPDAEAGRSALKIREEKGAKGIAKWLGMSWDELVANTKEERRRQLEGVDRCTT